MGYKVGGMETLTNPFFMILFVLTMIVISLSVISIRIQKSNKIQRKDFLEYGEHPIISQEQDLIKNYL
jgi:hypothetical protein